MNKSPIKIAKVQIFFLIAKKSLNTNRWNARNLQIGRGVWQKVVFLPLEVKNRKIYYFWAVWQKWEVLGAYAYPSLIVRLSFAHPSLILRLGGTQKFFLLGYR